MFSVIIPVYNKEQVIERCIKSVLNQTYQNFEIVVIDDGSADNSKYILSTIKDTRIKIITQTNFGVSVARNVGIENSVQPWICFLDADDEWLPNHLDILNELIKKYPDKRIFSAAHTIYHINGKIEESASNFPDFCTDTCIHDIFEILSTGITKALINSDTVCIDRRLFNEFGHFIPGVRIGEDTDMWYRILTKNDLVYSPISTTIYHREDSTATKYSTFNFEWPFEQRCKIYIHDETIDRKKRESIKHYYNLLIISKARQYIIRGKRKLALDTLSNLRMPIQQKKYLFITLLSFLVPNIIIEKLIKRRNRTYFAG